MNTGAGHVEIFADERGARRHMIGKAAVDDSDSRCDVLAADARLHAIFRTRQNGTAAELAARASRRRNGIDTRRLFRWCDSFKQQIAHAVFRTDAGCRCFCRIHSAAAAKADNRIDAIFPADPDSLFDFLQARIRTDMVINEDGTSTAQRFERFHKRRQITEPLE